MTNDVTIQDPALTGYTKVQQRYARWAPRYDRHWDRYSERTLAHAEALIRQYAPNAESMLDVACGTGLLEARLQRSMPHMTMVGVDVSADMLEQARARLNGAAEWRQATAESLPVENEAFDVVACCNAFHLVTDHRAALAEFRRALKPGGVVIILDWARDYVTVKLVDAGYKLLPGHPRQIRTSAELREVVAAAGFDVIDTQRFRATRVFKLASVAGRK